jgi:hypothetical protein
MKRTNLLLDIELLIEAKSLLNERTYSATVNRALQETVRLAKVRKLGTFFGSGIWKGSLSEMREDRRRGGRQK